jgi:EmrB/QacA subfamily drug resistance transporter
MTTETEAKNVNPWIVMVVVSMGFFMTLLDTTIVNIAVPSIIDHLHASLDEILWVLNGYTLVYAVLLITSGRLGDRVGPKPMFIAGAALFTAASVLCGLSNGPTQLIAARALQGLGGAIMAPQVLSIMLRVFAPEKRGAVFGVYGALAGVAVIAGPTLGGLLVTNFGWQAVFFVNLPIGIATIVAAAILVPHIGRGERHRFDIIGVVLATAGLGGITYGLIEGQRYNWGTITSFITIPEVIAAGVVLLVVFAIVETRRSEALLPMDLLRERNFSAGMTIAAIMGFAMVGLFLPLAIYLQSVLGLSAIDAGLTIAPMPLVMGFLAPVAGGLSERFGKWLLGAGMVTFAAGMAYIVVTAQAGSGRWSFLPGLLLGGIGMGFTWAPLGTMAMRDVPARLAGTASGVFTTIQEFGGVLAGAAVGAVLQHQLAIGLHDQAVAYSAKFPAPFRAQFVSGFSQSSGGGLEAGRQTGASIPLPTGIPLDVVHQIQAAAAAVFQHAFVDAMRPAMMLPVVAVVLGAVIAVTVLRQSGTASSTSTAADPVAA